VATVNKSGTPGNYITLRNYPGHSPIIQFDGQGGIKIADDMNNIIIEGFEVVGPSASIDYDMAMADREYKVLVSLDDDPNTNYAHSYFSGKGIWGGYGAHNNIIIRNNIVHDTPGSGIRFNDSDRITIEYNTVYNTTWWTSSASSAIVYAETIAAPDDNEAAIKMIMRGNVVYNNWNRIPFFTKSLPDNAQNNNEEYGSATHTTIVDGQGLYVTRSDPNYNGIFLFENNLCVNNGKNGINFDNSLAASAIYRNNTLYYNGAHEQIQDISVAQGNPAHRGQNVAGIKARNVLGVTIVNNIVISRPPSATPSYYDNFTVLEFLNVPNKTASNNIFVNGTYQWPATNNNNIVDVDPLFVSAPAVINGTVDMSSTDFSLQSNSPAINVGDSSYTPAYDILGNPRPELPDAISYSSFEGTAGGWSSFGATSQTSTVTSRTGGSSFLTTSRTLDWHSPKMDLDNLLTVGENYTFYVWVKLASGVSGTNQITIKNTDDGTYFDVTPRVTTSDQEWTLLTGDYPYSSNHNLFVYVKGPTDAEGGGDFYIDDFSLVPQGSSAVDFSVANDVVDIGAYEFLDSSLSIHQENENYQKFFAYPNPVKSNLTIANLTTQHVVIVMDLAGKQLQLPQQRNTQQQTLSLNVSNLNIGLYLLKIVNTANNKTQTLRFIKE
jgi:parallel beta-helix repeat protein